jgi:hypothetical protein
MLISTRKFLDKITVGGAVSGGTYSVEEVE